MQDPTDAGQIVEPEISDEDGSVPSPGPEDDSTDSDGAAEDSVVLAEVLPGIAVVYGNIPEALRQDLVGLDLSLPPTALSSPPRSPQRSGALHQWVGTS